MPCLQQVVGSKESNQQREEPKTGHRDGPGSKKCDINPE